MSTQFGLYFPYFHFQNDEWVKLAALYWDGMYRIVPEGYDTVRDSKLVHQLATNAHSEKSVFIKNIHPEYFYDDLHDISVQFMKLIENHGFELSKHYGIENRKKWEINKYSMLHSQNGDSSLAYIYNKKMDPELIGLMKSRRLGVTESHIVDGRERWIGMHPKLANVYMAALAEKLAMRTQSFPLADDPINYFAISGFSFERLAQVLLSDVNFEKKSLTDHEIEGCLAVIALKTVMPKDISNVPVEKIFELRDKYPGEMLQFQGLVHSVISELPNLKLASGNEFVQDHLEAEFNKRIKPKMDELDDAMNSIGIDTIQTVFDLEVKIPSFLASAGLLAGITAANPMLGATAAVAMSMWKIIADKRKAVKGEVKRSDVAYLMHIRDDLTPAGSLEWLDIQARKVLFGI